MPRRNDRRRPRTTIGVSPPGSPRAATPSPATAPPRVWVAAALTTAVLAAGCAGGDPPSVDEPPSATTVPAATTPGASTPTPAPSDGVTSLVPTSPPITTEQDVDPTLDVMVDAAVADLEQRSIGATGEITVVLARTETFPDDALGCPRPGEAVTQAEIDGYRILLARGDRVWLYTAPVGGDPVLCPSDEKDGGRDWVSPPGPDD